MRTVISNCRTAGTEKKTADLGVRILENCRNELCSLFPYLDGAFACLAYRPLPEESGCEGKPGSVQESGCEGKPESVQESGCERKSGSAQEPESVQELGIPQKPGSLPTPGRIGTRGESLMFEPAALARYYMEKPEGLRRGYLHILLHCLYLHPFQEESGDKALWNLACDMAVERVLCRTGAFSPEEDPVKERCLRIMGEHGVSAEQIYSMLRAGRFPFSPEELQKAFMFDDHGFWEWSGDGEKKAAARKKWEKAVAYAGQNKRDRKRKAGTKQGNGEEELEEVQRSRYDYRRFLKRFAVLREEVELDEDSFDYIYYNFGMEHYGNLPFVEPLEYKEVHRLEELVIAIDTSGSCSAATVRQFLAETFAILSEKENFFRKMKVYIIQCDCYVQDTAVIHSREEWDDYCKNIHIHGRGGTDFRPVFRYVEELQERKELRNLKALIYFTDGDGIYPRERTNYETAFVFLNKTTKMEMVPFWAEKLIVGGGPP